MDCWMEGVLLCEEQSLYLSINNMFYWMKEAGVEELKMWQKAQQWFLAAAEFTQAKSSGCMDLGKGLEKFWLFL